MKLLSKSLLLLLTELAFLSVSFAQITAPRTPSPGAAFTQTIGISSVTIKYSRPSVNNRKIWGELVPYGWTSAGSNPSVPWRAGANENTTINFSHNCKVEGIDVPAGTYGLFFVINPDNSGEVILSKKYRSWGSFTYDKAEDLMRAPIKIRDVSSHNERLTYDFVNITKNTGEVVLDWEKKQFPVKVEFAVDDIVIANAKDELRGPIGSNGLGWTSAANYCLTNDVDLDQGLRWIEKTSAIAPTFTALSIKSGILEKLGRQQEADKAMADALVNAREDELNLYAYQLMTEGKHDKAVETFLLTTQRYPKSANAWDSLGEGYATKGDNANAIKSFKKALTLNPSAVVRDNSEKFLKQLQGS
jgi:tetratricopeptide (TPR) repeat protein